MNGSNGSEGRRGVVSALRGLGSRSAAEAADEIARWPHLEAKQCALCEKLQRPAASCERPGAVEELLMKEASRRLPWPGYPRATVCKDCCIDALDGHHCVWWALCWRG